ncbi:MAG TPA: ADP-glyceromanno-heptose 6-epimerase [Chitinophagaceae bacterium]|jgi:ADP-L-glycero-D-manno-heptose 6-epimerase|nr:ADP-glyceromanno-heptose 6-epimerase [Chitinophagaceae bacterium]
MDRNSVILVTGAAGFIGSCMVGYLNRKGYHNIIIVDEFDDENKKHNYEDKKIITRVDRNELFNWLSNHPMQIDFIFHLGARTDTTEFDYTVLEKLNVDYSKKIWDYCVKKNIPLVYASSAATYGDGELGYKDDHELPYKLNPLNPYGKSKNEFDKWVLKEKKQPPFWAGLKFFNVYGPNEYHKERMASVLFHSFNQIKSTGKVKLFKSHKPEYKDGEQLRDFVYVKDVVDICYWLMNEKPASGLYNLGTGKARTFKDLVTAIFKSLDKDPVIEFIDTPIDIRDKYQYFTEADMTKFRNAGYKEDFYSLEEGVETYVKNFLTDKKYY